MSSDGSVHLLRYILTNSGCKLDHTGCKLRKTDQGSILWVKEKKGFPGGSVVKNPFANAGDVGSVSGSGRSPREGNSNQLCIPAWKILWTEKSGRLQFKESQKELDVT